MLDVGVEVRYEVRFVVDLLAEASAAKRELGFEWLAVRSRYCPTFEVDVDVEVVVEVDAVDSTRLRLRFIMLRTDPASNGRLNLLELLAMLLIERVRSREWSLLVRVYADAGVTGDMRRECAWACSKCDGYEGDGNGSPHASGVELLARNREYDGGSEVAVGGVGGGR